MQWREALAEFQARRGQGKGPYPKELKRVVINYARAQIAAGGSCGEVARELGLDASTLKWWLDHARQKVPGRLLPAEIRRGENARAEQINTGTAVEERRYRVTVIDGLTMSELRKVLG